MDKGQSNPALRPPSQWPTGGQIGVSHLIRRLKLSPPRRRIAELRLRAQLGSINECARILRRSLAASR
jgi:hypothetical protein